MTNIERLTALARACARPVATAVAWCALAGALSVGGAIAAPAAGDSWAYSVANGYNREILGRLEYRVESVAAERVTVALTTNVALLGRPRSEVYTLDGNWLRHALINHDQPVEYEFAKPYPAYVFPLDIGKSWSVRVPATNSATGKRVSVRVDGDVLGTERITVPAGAFDTIKLRRRIYAGDWDGRRAETNITEIEWYAPALGRAVRADTKSDYWDPQRCTDEMSACTPVRGDWHVFELVDTRR